MIKSPCKNICKIDEGNGLCIGCYRDIEEVSNWIYLTDEQKKIVLSKAQERAKINNSAKKNMLEQNLLNNEI
tara:strand:+ start:1626 stop:1841 length:216 start_codon:yes stop_codon:yes gene_type:complete